MVLTPDPKVSSEVDLLRLMLRGSSVKATLLRPESSLDSSLVGGGHKFRDPIQWKILLFSFGLKNGLRFYFDFLETAISSINWSDFSDQNS